jgi:hypothetical protein
MKIAKEGFLLHEILNLSYLASCRKKEVATETDINSKTVSISIVLK